MTLAIILVQDGASALQALGAGLASSVLAIGRRERFDLLEHLGVLGITRIVFPSREYRSETAGRGGIYETARLLPRGDDGGFADAFLEESLSSRHIADT